MSRILVIDDDIDLCELISDYLASEGFALDTVQNGEEGVRQALTGDHDLIVLDVMLPGISGFEVLRRIRAASAVPVLMLTARGDDVDRIVGLEMGADDYLPKPFNPRELVARIRAIQRRMATAAVEETLSPARLLLGDVELDGATRQVHRGGVQLDLTSVEFALMEVFLRLAGQVISREELSRQALGRQLHSYDRSIDVHVSNLRKKLGPLGDGGERIKAVRGIGYIYTRPSGEH
ncbi:MAG: response regulator transcription factor [Oryzomonas sp.]|uniref:response regulator transcription factor n=1 Tax=Oryzomonas sp. TaxID=2855186 RepID=UPI002847DD39|nr:response regulator transcription factor [Oryzomonas sp.]MDR3579244.1 response regulator transcription factor [Oryzomonas sp.]